MRAQIPALEDLPEEGQLHGLPTRDRALLPTSAQGEAVTALAFSGLALLVTVTMAMVDFAHARYALAMYEHRRRRHRVPWWRAMAAPVNVPELRAAARWSVVQWAAASVGFVVAVRVSIWLLPFEGLGLWLGTMLGGTRAEGCRVDQV